jgi:ssDNA-binding Zn-finger/Zn-ribbon topoisomerase 1
MENDAMKPHPTPRRIRKAIKWGKYGGAAVTVLLVVMWIASGRVRVVWAPTMSGWRAQIRDGACMVGDYAEFGLRMVEEERPRGGVIPAWGWCGTVIQSRWSWQLRPQWGEQHPFDGVKSLWVVPLWIPLLVIALAAAAVWSYDFSRARRCARLNRCPKCNYDRAGLGIGAVCPECGDRPKIG